MPTFSVENDKLKGKLRGWVSGWSLLPIHLKDQARDEGFFFLSPQFPSILPFLPRPFDAYHAGYSQLKLRAQSNPGL